MELKKDLQKPLFINLKFLLLAGLHRRHHRPVSFLKRFSYKDLKRATDDFRRIITSRPDGVAYEAKFPDGSVALVKEIRGAKQEKDVFYREVQLLGSLHHRHLVALRGYSAGHRSFLVFESTGYGSLKEHLNDPLKTPLSWKTRLHIAIGVAAALEYLHFFCEPPIHHISISSSSIMLDERLAAKLSDINLLDSVGYHFEMPDASCRNVCVDPKCRDLVRQFGELILELITGQSSEKGSADVLEWIQESHFGVSMHKMIDPDLGNSYDPKVLRTWKFLCILCSQGLTGIAGWRDGHAICWPNGNGISSWAGVDMPIYFGPGTSAFWCR
ncbi:hypothetical protein Nepgr_014537 [Nepenthes gracilis]|uniref:Protein kinase domain-containing protein n=1 Tax=Nepenthes gracilis TaxID=150966 RepID=A0AAD3SLC7_NEPGR|nr:hypothetical protein Nepgr_014537 [Nepenthes gracilis]